MKRRQFIQLAATGAAASALPNWAQAEPGSAPSVSSLPALEGELTLYLGRGEGGLYENVLSAIKDRNPKFKLNIRRGPTASLANAIVAEGKAGVRRADVFWAVDSGAIGLVAETGLVKPLAQDLQAQLRPEFRYPNWAPVSGRVRTLPYYSKNLTASDIPSDIMALPDSGLRLAWAPAYASFQSFVTALRLLEGEAATIDWLRRADKNASRYAGELGVVMAAERGEVDVGFANHYYTLRLKAGKPDAQVDLAFTKNDAGCLVNASGVVVLSESELARNFIRYLFTREVQSYLAREAYELPMVAGIKPPKGLPSLEAISPPKLDLTQLADLRPTLKLMRNAGVL
ncbi:MAG: extracellular solute-binding protein [Cellvibrionaceae bacterium]|nr:extracellular solute-binding protein [Cellvibrionaceae bacterium]